MNDLYNPQEIERIAQEYWEAHQCFQADEKSNKTKFYCLSMFPYPSGYLHMGHVRNYTIGDVIARFQRMQGKNVMQPMGWDAFGLPAENAAIQNKIPPAEWTYKNIAYMRTQFKRMGFAYDWSREITTCDPKYYRWEQWFFVKLFEKGLVYKKNAEVNWDPVDQTILANEQVVDGRGWRSGALVERREIPQWFLKITAYADELLNDIDTLEQWPDQVRAMQRNWIGRSEGTEVIFPISNSDVKLTIFTTRPDTLFGVTYIALAPQHPLAKQAAEKNPALQQFLDECRNIKVAEADLATMPKKGVNTGLTAVHPLTNEIIPIWVANFVLMEYGAGAVMAVPAHDQRDHDFAKQYHLSIKQVITPLDDSAWDFSKAAFVDDGKLIHSQTFDNLESEKACAAITDALIAANKGQRKINFRLRDWSVSRQRYWGTPIPIVNCPTCGAVGEKNLPVVLPENIQFTGVSSPLKTMPEFYKTTCPKCGGPAERETDTFDTFFESSWYYARFACKNLETAMLDERANYWVPVDQYIGGIEHAVMHLLYARFMHKLLRDEGLVNSDEPFKRLLTQGMVLNQGIKMSKSIGNTVEPAPLIDRYGTDTVRLFSIFAAPPEQNLEWSDSGVEGAHRFLKRVWALAYENREALEKENKALKANTSRFKTIQWENTDAKQRNVLRQVYEILEQAQYDYDRLQFNTVVSGCMKLLNLLTKIPEATHAEADIQLYIIHTGISILLRLLAPIAPHITHQLWQDLHFENAMIDATWPASSKSALKMDHVELVVQINGKLRSRIQAPSDADQKTLEQIALADAKVQHAMAEQVVKKVIVVPGKLINIVAGAKS